MHSKRKADTDGVEQELLKHLRCKMTQNEAFAYSVAQSLDRKDERKCPVQSCSSADSIQV